VHTSEYGPDRKLIAYSFEYNGKVDAHSSSEDSETYDAQGNLLSNRWANGDGTFGETFYEYDEAGRQRLMTNNQNSNRTEYLYNVDGLLTTCIETFDPNNPAGTDSSHAFLGSRTFGVPTGGSAITTYDNRDNVVCNRCGKKHSTENPIELRILTADGQLVSQWVRKWDASGRLEEEKPLQQNDGLLFLERMTPEQRTTLTPEQVQAIAKQLNEMRGKLPPRTRYKYDAQGRLIEKRDRDILYEHTTAIEYNDQGDIKRRRETYTDNSVNAQGNRLPEDMDTRFSYQYDSYNWTEKVVTCTGSPASRSWASTTRRTITYYS
jgi:hypothetical protein